MVQFFKEKIAKFLRYLRCRQVLRYNQALIQKEMGMLFIRFGEHRSNEATALIKLLLELSFNMELLEARRHKPDIHVGRLQVLSDLRLWLDQATSPPVPQSDKKTKGLRFRSGRESNGTE